MGKKLLTQNTKCSLSIPSIVFSHWFSEWEFLIAPLPLIIIIAYFFPFRCHFREVTFTARLEIRKYKYSRPLMSIDYLKQIHIPFNDVSGSHFYGKSYIVYLDIIQA